MARSDDPTLVRLVDLFVEQGRSQLELFIHQFNPETARGKIVPILQEEVDEEMEWRVLEEAKRKSDLVAQGALEADEDVTAFDANEDGAQQRLVELRQKFSADGGS